MVRYVMANEKKEKTRIGSFLLKISDMWIK